MEMKELEPNGSENAMYRATAATLDQSLTGGDGLWSLKRRRLTKLGVTTMATSIAPPLIIPSPLASWCFLVLEHLEEFATLAWYLVADGKLVEDTFSRTMAKLEMISFESSIPVLAYNQARDVLITQAIAVLSDVRREEDDNSFFQPTSLDRLPDLQRLAFMLRLIIRSSEVEVAKFLSVSPSEVQGLVKSAINRLSVVPLISAPIGSYDA